MGWGRRMKQGDRGGAAITLNITDPVTGNTQAITIDAATFLHFHQLIKTEGADHAYTIATAGLQFAQHDVSEHDVKWIQAVLRGIQNVPEFSQEELLLSLAYWNLRLKKTTREESATHASAFLSTTISTDAWRKRVDRWAKAQGYDALGQTKRRPRTLSGRERGNMSR